MIYSRKYSRNFVPLKQDNTNFNLDFRPAIGKCLIEIKDNKGKITVYAQGIKPNNDYDVEIMCFEKGILKNANIGKILIDETGKGELKCDFNPDNVLNTGNKIEDFNIIAIMVSGMDKVVSSLVGYVGSEVNWKNKYNISKENIKLDDEPLDFKVAQVNDEINKISENITEENKQYTEFEKALIEREQGLIEREQGLIEREKGIVYKEENMNMPVDLTQLQKSLFEKEQGLLQKEQGLAQKEQGLFDKEMALNQGYLPSDENFALRDKEMDLIQIEKQLIKKEEGLIKREQNILKNLNQPCSDLERALREKQKGLIEREKGLLEREKGLLEKELGLFEKEQGIRDRNNGIKEREEGLNLQENETNDNCNKNESFKDMIKQIKNDIYNSDNTEFETGNENKIKENFDLDYIRFKNMSLKPFKNNNNISWFRISPYELASFDSDVWKYINNPFIYSSYKKYNHLMVGIKNDNNKESYILGVPCKYTSKFYVKGFETFVPLDENISTNNLKEGEYGYRFLDI